jgi:LysM repeat protein
MALPLIPIIMAGARVITRVAPAIAKRLIKAGKAKPAKGKPGEQLELPLGKPVPKAPATSGAPKIPPLKGKGKLDLRKKTTSTLNIKPGTGKPRSRKGSGLKEAAIAGTVVTGGAALFGGGTKSVTVKSGDTLSQIAKDNNTTLAAIKKANPNITDIHSIRPGQKVKVPKVKGRTSVYQGLSKSELKGKKPKRGERTKEYPMGFGPDNMGNVVKNESSARKAPSLRPIHKYNKASGGKVKKYKEGRTIGGSSRGGASHVLPRTPRLPKPKPKGVGAAIRGWGRTGH